MEAPPPVGFYTLLAQATCSRIDLKGRSSTSQTDSQPSPTQMQQEQHQHSLSAKRSSIGVKVCNC